MKLSIIMPVYNEEKTLRKILDSVRNAPLPDEIDNFSIIIVDDGSTDNTRDILKDIKEDSVDIFFHGKNQGKGAALRTGIQKADGDIIIIQDADLEYDPIEYPNLLNPIIQGKADVVYGSRFQGHGPHRVVYYWHRMGNSFLTIVSNMFTNINLTDMETCYKVFRSEIIKSIDIKENRFGFEPEITAKVAKKKCRIYEVGISYYGRTYEEGKKINWKDGVKAIWCIIKYNLFHRE